MELLKIFYEEVFYKSVTSNLLQSIKKQFWHYSEWRHCILDNYIVFHGQEKWISYFSGIFAGLYSGVIMPEYYSLKNIRILNSD